MPWIKYSEGNANILFQNKQQYHDKLLRIRKKNHGISIIENYKYWSSRIEPQLNRYCIDTKLITLDSKIVEQLSEQSKDIDLNEKNALLLEFIGIDDDIRRRINLNYNHGLIRESRDHLILEFKPKWLVKSPNFEKSAICRNCALRYLKDGQIPKFCPMMLSSGMNIKTVRVGFQHLLDSYEPELSNISKHQLIDILASFWTSNDLRDCLSNMQKLDSTGILNRPENSPLDDDFLVAMSARDCTVFIEVFNKPIDKTCSIVQLNDIRYYVRCKVGDFDKKSVVKKRDYWYSMETELLKIMKSKLKCFQGLMVPEDEVKQVVEGDRGGPRRLTD